MSFLNVRGVVNSFSRGAYNLYSHRSDYFSRSSIIGRVSSSFTRVALSTFNGALKGSFQGPLLGWPMHLYSHSLLIKEVMDKIFLVSSLSLCVSHGFIIPSAAFFSSFANRAALNTDLSKEVLLYTADYIHTGLSLKCMQGAIFGGTISCIEAGYKEIFSSREAGTEDRGVSVAARGFAGAASSLVVQDLGLSVLSSGVKSMGSFAVWKISANALPAKIRSELGALNWKNISYDCIQSLLVYMLFEELYNLSLSC